MSNNPLDVVSGINRQYSLRLRRIIVNYNIASRAAQSNSVYVSVLKISIVLADGVSKWLCQNFFFTRAVLVSAGKNIIFRCNNRYKQRLCPLVAKRRQFSDLFSWSRVLMRQKKRKTMEKETRHQRRHDSLPRVKCNLDRKTLW